MQIAHGVSSLLGTSWWFIFPVGLKISTNSTSLVGKDMIIECRVSMHPYLS